jgi:hypothetical protein
MDVNDNMVEIKVTPEMVRHIIKEKDRLITTEQASMFLQLFGERIEDAMRQALIDEVRKHYD